MAYIYPENPRFDPLVVKGRNDPNPDLKEAWAHDPSLFQDDDGTYYAFSTDNHGTRGYQIRKSSDLIHWNYVGSAFDLQGSEAAYRNGEAYDKFSCLQPAYNWTLTHAEELTNACQICTKPTGEMGFWAPYVTKGADGKYWLYFCLTGYFGGSRSCIGVAKSDVVTGPYNFVDFIVCSAAGWRSPNAIDPQIVYDAEGEMHMCYGSYGLGIYLIDLDKETGKRKDGLRREDFDAGRCSFDEYFGVHLAYGSLEGSVIKYHEGVDVLEDGKWVKKNYYYLMCSFGSLSTVYNMRCGRSESVYGPYIDVNGNQLVCATDMGSGNKLMGSFRWEDSKFDYFCPGHNDMMITKDGKNVISYHCRTHGLPVPEDVPAKFKKKFVPHFLFVNQYTFNADGWMVMNPNRYAKEDVNQTVTQEEILSVSKGYFSMVLFSQDANQEHTVKAKRVKLHKNGKISGFYKGTWKFHDGKYVDVVVGGKEYRGTVMPCWINEQDRAGVTISCMGVKSGMALYLNSYNKKKTDNQVKKMK